VQGEERLRFSLSVPDLEPPEGGWPVILYAHGTGGNYESYRRSGIALALAQQGLATLSIDQVHHGPRALGACDGSEDQASCVSLLFFNFINPVAGRDNVRQGALDLISLARLAEQLEISAEESELGRSVRLNGEKLALMGHSQGGLNGPLFLAVEPRALGAMLSGAGSNIAISIEQKKRPLDINALAKQALGFEPDGVLDRWHPALALLQTFIEPGDASNYAPLWFNRPPAGYPAKSVFMTAGLNDSYTPPETIFALAIAGRVPLIEPIFQEIDALNYLAVDSAGLPPYAANVAEGRASAGLAQFEGQGHFLIFEDTSARRRAANFLKDLVNRPPPRIF
ncbi:MAG: alpha/beta fold hydrolase, partial [Myxococcota bacterium]|nr:alpha/beta fold hydrolase [Myxococcota bacterium]